MVMVLSAEEIEQRTVAHGAKKEADVEREAEVKRKGEAEVQADVENSEVRKVYPNSKNSTVQF